MRGRSSAVLTGAAVLTLVFTGCGDQGSSGAQEGASTSSPASPARTESKSATPKKPSTQKPSKSKPSKERATPARTEPTRQGRIATKCEATHLRPRIEMRDSAAGRRHAWLVLTNTSETTCTVFGYGGMQLYDDEREPVPTDLVRDRTRTPQTLRVAPDESVRSALRWSAVPRDGDRANGTCQPVASFARVTPPDETRNIDMRWSYGPVCAGGRIVQQPYRGTVLGPGD